MINTKHIEIDNTDDYIRIGFNEETLQAINNLTEEVKRIATILNLRLSDGRTINR